jgi:hypothetical protein
MLERLEQAACRMEMADRRLNAHPPAYVRRALAKHASWPAIRETRVVGLSVPW